MSAKPELGSRRQERAADAGGNASTSRGVAPGKRTLTEAHGAGRGAAGGSERSGAARGGATEAERAGDWEMSEGLMSAMGLGGGDAISSLIGAEPRVPAAPAAAVQQRARGTSPPGTPIQARDGAVGEGGGGSGAKGADLGATADRGVAGASSPLPHLDVIQQAFGKHDVSGVRAQVGGEASEAAGAIGAQAYATGDRVAFAQAPDLHTAAHEAAHVVQQAGGVQLKDGLGQVGDRYEQHADAVADAVVAGKSAEGLLDGFAPASSSAAAAAPAAQRKAVQRVAAVYKSAAQIKAMTLAGFDAYAHAQIDWATSATLGDDKELLRGMLGFARRDGRLILDAFGPFSVNELMMCGAGVPEVDDLFLAYARGVRRAANTVHIDVLADNARMAAQWGDTILKLTAKLTGPIVQRVISQNASYQALRTLAASDELFGDFIKYYDSVQPFLDAKDGKEIRSYVAFRDEGGQGKVAKYKAGLTEVKNYHRFTVAQLDLMHRNREIGPTNPAKTWSYDISVVLQTALDHNSAFHRDPYLDAVLGRFSYLTLFAEGKATLADYTAELNKFATYSKTGKVKEVMVAGHGSAKSMQLAGTSNAPADKEDLTVKPDASGAQRQATTTFFDAIRAVLANDADARLVLKACLTASNSVDGVQLNADPAIAAQQIKDAIRDNPSLTNHARARMGRTNAQVRGANGSFSSPHLLDGSKLDLVSELDPMLTASKLEYVKGGTDPTGVLRAVLESWAHDKAATINAVKARVLANAASTAWKERVIVAVMKLIKAAPDDAARIRTLEDAAAGLSHLIHPGDNQVAMLKRHMPAAFTQAFMDAVFTDMTGAAYWADASHSYIPLVMYQVWSAKNAAKIPAFLAFLDASTFTTQSAKRFVDLAHITPMAAQLMPAVAGVPPRGSFLLALLHLAKQGAAAPAEAKTYIANVVGDGNHDFPGDSNVDAILKATSKRSVLEAAGVLVPAGQAGAVAAVANLAPTGAGDNTLAIGSVTEKCRTQGGADTNAYALPGGARVGGIPTGTALHVIGKTRAAVQVPAQVPVVAPVALPLPQAGGDGAQAQPPVAQPQPLPPPVDLLAVEHTIGTDKTVFVVAADVQML